MNEKDFKTYDWFGFYCDAKEAIHSNIPKARENTVIISCFVDANHAGDVKDRRSQTGILIFLNRAPIHWYNKKQTSVESSSFGTEFVDLKINT